MVLIPITAEGSLSLTGLRVFNNALHQVKELLSAPSLFECFYLKECSAAGHVSLMSQSKQASQRTKVNLDYNDLPLHTCTINLKCPGNQIRVILRNSKKTVFWFWEEDEFVMLKKKNYIRGWG